jgi:hypothetical protein
VLLSYVIGPTPGRPNAGIGTRTCGSDLPRRPREDDPSRDTVQRTNKLLGTKYKGSAIPGESKSYADQFEDLRGAVSRRARHSVTRGDIPF